MRQGMISMSLWHDVTPRTRSVICYTTWLNAVMDCNTFWFLHFATWLTPFFLPAEIKFRKYTPGDRSSYSSLYPFLRRKKPPLWRRRWSRQCRGRRRRPARGWSESGRLPQTISVAEWPHTKQNKVGRWQNSQNNRSVPGIQENS